MGSVKDVETRDIDQEEFDEMLLLGDESEEDARDNTG